MPLGLIICSDGDLLSSGQLDRLTIFQETCADLWALQKVTATLTSRLRSAADPEQASLNMPHDGSNAADQGAEKV